MLRITVELVPFGKEEYKRTLGGLEITNDGTGTYAVGNYKYKILDDTSTIKGKLKGHNRMQSVFHLIKDILNKSII
jgi:hypothetical protein